MTAISDVFAFAAKNPDYWVDLLSGDEYPTELTPEEAKALDAARAHIDETVVELLHASGAKLATKLGAERLAPQRFKAASTRQNKFVSVAAPRGLEGALYRVSFGLERSEDGKTISLYASLVVKKGALDELRKALDRKGVEHGLDNYHVFAPSISLKHGAELDAIATQAADYACRLLSGFE